MLVHTPCAEWLLIAMNAACPSLYPGIFVRPRKAPGLSAGGLQVARRQVTLKPPLVQDHTTTQKAPAC
ncbi:hypothetical protein AL073_18285 [Loktanella sp. 1ANDIMAR09]|nr:hypothetical protein AL073_18285 [Loktanella sp. 1ANDIMAR09]